MEVNFAIQFLSHKVAARIFTLVKTNYFDSKAMKTALFIKKMDGIFNTMKSLIRFSSRSNGNAITSENIRNLKDAIEILKNIKPVNDRNYRSLMDGYLHYLAQYNYGMILKNHMIIY